MHGAVVDGPYRYLLWRTVSASDRTVLWVMLNPSTADAFVDDPTIRRVLGFSSLWGYGRVEVVNLFAARATDPRELERFADPVGPRNDDHIRAAVARAHAIVCAWGAHKGAGPERRAREVRQLLPPPTYCLGVTAGGHPKHPLYLSASTPLLTFGGEL